MLGGFPPSFGYGGRLYKIFRAEWRRQARFYRDWLHASILCDGSVRRAKQKWREFSRLLAFSTEAFWHRVLDSLRPLVPPKVLPSEDRLHSSGDVELPEDFGRILRLGPKFAVQPRKDAAELLACVRDVARRAPEDERDSCVAQGMNVLASCGQQLSGVRLVRLVTTLREHELCVLPADKEGRFAVLRQEVYRELGQKLYTNRRRKFSRTPGYQLLQGGPLFRH
ncbi:hypothetical protein HPB52_023331 [Rhipicephalus sanguineus]|uniref:Uncharacterized protein n=1 Tax=Rhipicephalus sanguineus TaxID=34632 RepID=A0A9D4QBI3_RHISA|nr:hypothetical protein HPB52_023331 [Rhipicephalus sanguineus]